MKKVALIPARYHASRLPGKLMKDLSGVPVIVKTYRAIKSTQLFDDVLVVTDSKIIFNTLVSHNAKAVISQKKHDSGTDRIAEAAKDMEVDIVVNVQGDEPFTKKKPLEDLLNVLEKDKKQEIDIVSLMTPLSDRVSIESSNEVKVVVDEKQFALYFSRAPIPYPREVSKAKYYKHIGIYAFRKDVLLEVTREPMTALEQTEKLENLRFLGLGKKIKMVTTNNISISIDTIEDYRRALKFIE